MVKHDIDHSVGKIASRTALGNGSIWFQSSQGSDEPKRTHLPPADSRCYFTYRMINNIYYDPEKLYDEYLDYFFFRPVTKSSINYELIAIGSRFAELLCGQLQ